MNIKLLIENKHPLVLGENVNVQLVRQNNFWREQVEFSFEYSLPFDLPYCQINAELLGFPENINSRRRVIKPVTLIIKNTQRMSGQLIVLDSSYDGYVVALVKKASYDLDKKLSEVVDITYPVPDLETDITNQLALKYLDGQDFNWPQIVIANENSKQAYPTYYNPSISAGLYWTYLNYFNGTLEKFDTNSPMSPQFFLPAVVREVSKYYGWRFVSPWLVSDSIRDKMVCNTTAFVSTPERFFKPYLQWQPNGLLFHLWVGVETPYDSATYPKYSPAIGDIVTLVIYRYNVTTLAATGTTTVNYTIQASDIGNIGNYFTHLMAAIIAVDPNYSLVSTFIGQDDPGIFIQYVAGGVSQFLSTYSSLPAPDTKEKIYQAVEPATTAFVISDIQMSKHLPDITVAEFFQALKDTFNLSISFDFRTEQVYITPKRDLLSWRTIDLTKYVLAYPVTSEVELPVYKLIYEVDDFEVYTLSDLSYYAEATEAPGYLLTKGTTNIEPKAGRVFAPAFGFPNGNAGAATQPITEFEIGNYTTPASNPLRFITWKGLQNDSLGYDYPRADMEDLNPDDLYAEYYDAWVKFSTSDPRRLRVKLNLPFEVLNTIDPLLRWRISEVNHIWVEVVEKYTANDIELEAILARI